MDLGLKGKIAAVAASSQGLGFAAARALAGEGAHLGMCSRERARIEAAGRRIQKDTGAEVLTHACDLADPAQAQGFIDAVVGRYGRLDVLVTNAGGPPPGHFDDIDITSVRRGFDLTLMSAITLMKAAIPHMRKQKWGRVVNIMSITVKQPETNLLLSNTMRTALVGFTKSVSNELARDNVLINNVAPGYTQTERLDDLAQNLAQRNEVSVAEVFAGWEKKIPMGRLGKPEELANMIAFLASERASYVTGVTVQVDGGFVQGIL